MNFKLNCYKNNELILSKAFTQEEIIEKCDWKYLFREKLDLNGYAYNFQEMEKEEIYKLFSPYYKQLTVIKEYEDEYWDEDANGYLPYYYINVSYFKEPESNEQIIDKICHSLHCIDKDLLTIKDFVDCGFIIGIDEDSYVDEITDNNILNNIVYFEDNNYDYHIIKTKDNSFYLIENFNDFIKQLNLKFKSDYIIDFSIEINKNYKTIKNKEIKIIDYNYEDNLFVSYDNNEEIYYNSEGKCFTKSCLNKLNLLSLPKIDKYLENKEYNVLYQS